MYNIHWKRQNIFVLIMQKCVDEKGNYHMIWKLSLAVTFSEMTLMELGIFWVVNG